MLVVPVFVVLAFQSKSSYAILLIFYLFCHTTISGDTKNTGTSTICGKNLEKCFLQTYGSTLDKQRICVKTSKRQLK